MTRFDSTIARLSFLKAKLCERAPPSVANLLALPIMKERQSGFMHLPALTKRRQVTKTRNVKSCPREANGGEIKPPCALELMNWQRLVKWLNETFPIRVLVAFASVLAAVVLWKALEGLVG